MENVLPTTLVAETVVQQEQDSDTDMALQLAEQLLPVHSLEEESEPPDHEAGVPTNSLSANSDQLLSESIHTGRQ